jgi:hypothetical protein
VSHIFVSSLAAECNMQTQSYAEQITSDTDWFARYEAWYSLLQEAERLYEQKGLAELYDKVGQACLDDPELTQQLLPELVAGLCFETSGNREKAGQCYEHMLIQWDEMKGRIENLESLESVIYSRSLYLQFTFAALKCERKDLFVEIIKHQLKGIDAIARNLNEYESDDIPCKDIRGLLMYGVSLYHVSKTILGRHASEVVKMKEQYPFLNKDFLDLPDQWKSILFDLEKMRVEQEGYLYSIYNAFFATSPGEMIRRFEKCRP